MWKVDESGLNAEADTYGVKITTQLDADGLYRVKANNRHVAVFSTAEDAKAFITDYVQAYKKES